MSLGQRRTSRKGRHYELALEAVKRLKRENFAIKAKTEKQFEYILVSCLNNSSKLRKNLITQTTENEVEKINRSRLFGFGHAPDVTIGNDGTAIELKVIYNGQSIRDAIGQAIFYRMSYRYAIIVLIDHTNDRVLIESCKTNKSKERQFLKSLCDEFNIFSIVGAVEQNKNIAFCPNS